MIVFYLIGLMFATLGTYLWIDAYQFRNRARTIKGKIFSYDSKPYKNGHMYTLVIQYRDQDKIFHFKSSISGNSREYKIGEDVDVLVIDGNHHNARLKQGLRPFLSIVIDLMGLLFIGIYLMSTFNVIALGIAVVFVPLAVYMLQILNRRHNQSIQKEFEYERNEEGVVSNVVMDDVIIENATYDETAVRNAHVWMFAAGVITLAFSIYWFIDTKSLVDSSVKTTGTIVSQKRSIDHDTYTTIVLFRPYKRDAVRFEGTSGSSHTSWSIGDNVTVLYDPENSKRAMIDHGFNYPGPLAMGIFALFSFFGSIWLYR